MSQGASPEPRGLWQELMRRRVVRVAVLYIAVAWTVIEVAETVVPYVGLSERVITLVIVLAGLGLPLALTLAWAYQVTRDQPGVERTEGARSARGRARGVALAALGVIVVAGTIVVARRARLPAQPAGSLDPSVIAILPFEVRGAAGFEDLGEGIVGLLGTKLDGAGTLRTVDGRALLSLVRRSGMSPDPAGGRSIAGQFGAGYFVLGDILQAGDGLEITASLYRADRPGAATLTASARGSSRNLFGIVDDLAAQLLAGMAGGPSSRVTRIAAVTTESLAALRAYLEGEQLERGAQFSAAVAAYQNAVALDSAFALAWYRLAVTAEWNLQEDLARTAADQATRLADRLSDRDRRLLEAFAVRRRGANAEAEPLYRSILGTWPDEIEAWIDLQEILFHASPLQGRSFTEARSALERTLFFEETHSTSLIHLARMAAFEGRAAEMDTLVAKFLALNPEADRGFEVRALHAFARAEPGPIAAVLEDLRTADDQSVALAAWDVAVFARDVDGAIQLARLLTAPTRSLEARTLGHTWLSHLYIAKGQLEAALAELATLEGFNAAVAVETRVLIAGIPFLPLDTATLRRDRTTLERLDPRSVPASNNPSVVFSAHDRLHAILREYLLGLASVRLGDATRATRHAERVEAMEVPPTAGSLAGDLARSLRAQIRRAAGDAAGALALLEGARMETWYGQTLASPYYAQVLERFQRAELLDVLGRGEQALPWYEHIAELSPFETAYLAVSHLRQSAIHERAGRMEEARRHAAAAIALWSDADPVLAGQLDAARRLVAPEAR